MAARSPGAQVQPHPVGVATGDEPDPAGGHMDHGSGRHRPLRHSVAAKPPVVLRCAAGIGCRSRGNGPRGAGAPDLDGLRRGRSAPGASPGPGPRAGGRGGSGTGRRSVHRQDGNADPAGASSLRRRGVHRLGEGLRRGGARGDGGRRPRSECDDASPGGSVARGRRRMGRRIERRVLVGAEVELGRVRGPWVVGSRCTPARGCGGPVGVGASRIPRAGRTTGPGPGPQRGSGAREFPARGTRAGRAGGPGRGGAPRCPLHGRVSPR